MIHECNRFMGGVDLCDMFLSLYRVKLKRPKWYFPIFFYLIKVALANGWLLCRRHEKQRGTPVRSQLQLVEFQSQVAYDLVNFELQNQKRDEQVVVLFQPERPDLTKLVIFQRTRRNIMDVGYVQKECSKFLISLCFTKDRHCFLNFHVR